MATAKVISTLEITERGKTHLAKHGTDSSSERLPLEITDLDGKVHLTSGTLQDAAGVTLWNTSDDTPTTFDLAHLWTETNMVVQLIGDSSNVGIRVRAKTPFWLSFDDIVFAANTTVLSSDPSYENIDKIFLWNDSGGEGDFSFLLLGDP